MASETLKLGARDRSIRMRSIKVGSLSVYTICRQLNTRRVSALYHSIAGHGWHLGSVIICAYFHPGGSLLKDYGADEVLFGVVSGCHRVVAAQVVGLEVVPGQCIGSREDALTWEEAIQLSWFGNLPSKLARESPPNLWTQLLYLIRLLETKYIRQLGEGIYRLSLKVWDADDNLQLIFPPKSGSEVPIIFRQLMSRVRDMLRAVNFSKSKYPNLKETILSNLTYLAGLDDVDTRRTTFLELSHHDPIWRFLEEEIETVIWKRTKKDTESRLRLKRRVRESAGRVRESAGECEEQELPREQGREPVGLESPSRPGQVIPGSKTRKKIRPSSRTGPTELSNSPVPERAARITKVARKTPRCARRICVDDEEQTTEEEGTGASPDMAHSSRIRPVDDEISEPQEGSVRTTEENMTREEGGENFSPAHHDNPSAAGTQGEVTGTVQDLQTPRHSLVVVPNLSSIDRWVRHEPDWMEALQRRLTSDQESQYPLKRLDFLFERETDPDHGDCIRARFYLPPGFRVPVPCGILGRMTGSLCSRWEPQAMRDIVIEAIPALAVHLADLGVGSILEREKVSFFDAFPPAQTENSNTEQSSSQVSWLELKDSGLFQKEYPFVSGRSACENADLRGRIQSWTEMAIHDGVWLVVASDAPVIAGNRLRLWRLKGTSLAKL